MLLVSVLALNPSVTQENIQQTICIKGYTKSVRPTSSFTNIIKAQMLREQGIEAEDISLFELDHKIPLAIGGNPSNLENFQLQLWEEAKKKDAIERRLHKLVCKGDVLLKDARSCMLNDWRKCP